MLLQLYAIANVGTSRYNTREHQCYKRINLWLVV